LTFLNVSPEIANRVEKWRDSLSRLGAVSELAYDDKSPDNAVSFIVQGSVVTLSLGGSVDMASARQRLLEEQKRVHDMLADVEAKLADPNFVERAQEDVVETYRSRREAAQERDVLLSRILECL
jgi:valyl-tRNA synthetase